jgi:DNA invertase Pin-like site-specific DNA recombinase
LNIAVYTRVSRIDLHPENQELALKRRVEAEGWDATWFEEKESTRKTRPVKEEVLRRLRSREFSGVLVYSLDRWCRSVSEFAQELEEFKARGIGFYSLREGFSFDSAMGTAMAQITMVFAQLERDLIRERTKAGLERAKAWGKKLGRPKGSLGIKKRKLAVKEGLKT